jgi:mRNA interferase RelE/StbE
MYRVLLERGAEKDLGRLSTDIHDRVIAAIRRLAKNPRPTGCRKLAGSDNDWRIRVGDHRVIYEIADEIRVVRSTAFDTAEKFIAEGSCPHHPAQL